MTGSSPNSQQTWAHRHYNRRRGQACDCCGPDVAVETGHTHTRSHTRICLELDHWEIKMVAQSNRILLANHGLILDVFTVQVCVSRRACASAGQRTGAPHTHRLITMTTSERYSPRLSGIGHLVQKSNYWPIKWFYSSVQCVCVFKAVSSVNVFWLSGGEKTNLHEFSVSQHALQLHLHLPALQEWAEQRISRHTRRTLSFLKEDTRWQCGPATSSCRKQKRKKRPEAVAAWRQKVNHFITLKFSYKQCIHTRFILLQT